MFRVETLSPSGVLYSVTVGRAALPAAYREALRRAWRAKGGALASVTQA